MKLLRILGIIIVLVALAVVALPFLVDVNQFRPRLETELTTVLGRQVSVGNLKLSLLSGSVAADDLSIADDPAFSKTPFLQAKSLNVGVELMPFITSRKINVTGITIDQPQISLLQTPAGEWNYAKLGSKPAAVPSAATPSAPPASPSGSSGIDLSVKDIKITNGRLTVGKTSGHGKPTVLDKVNLELRDYSPSSVMPFSLTASFPGGGDVKLDGKAGPIPPDNMEQMPVSASLALSHLELVSSGALNPAYGIDGLVGIDGSVDSNGKQIDIRGKIRAEKLKLVKGASPATRVVEFDFTMQHDLGTRAGSLVKGEVHIGAAQASLNGTYKPQGETTAITAVLSGPGMAVPELEGMLPALNIVLPAGSKLEGGTASAKLSVAGTLENLESSGTIGLSNTKLTGFDLGKKLSVIEKLAGIKGGPNTEIQTLSLNVKNNSQGTVVNEMQLVAPDIGEIGGSGTVSPDRALDFKMHATVKGGLLPAALGARTQSGIPFFIRGTASDPKFEPDLKGMAAGEVKDLKGDAVKAATGVLGGLLGKKKN
jgi:AsmA protein